jgi:hypothetical protein
VPRPTSPRISTNSPDRAQLAEKVAAIPDKLAAIQLSLRPLCNGDTHTIPVEAKQVIADACDSLHCAIADVLEIVQHMGGWPAVDGRSPFDTEKLASHRAETLERR